MSLPEALAADRAGDLESAAFSYEEVLASGDHSLLVLLNLALLYWQGTDPGLSAAKKLGPGFFDAAGRRIPEPFDMEECRALLREDPGTLVPAMNVFSATDGKEAREEARELLWQCREDGTTGARYVISVIEAVMKRAGL